MYELTKKLRDLVPYDPIQGDYKIRLDANESFIEIPPSEIQKAMANTALNRYPDPYAVKTIGAYADFYGLDPDNLTAGNGSDELISIITACFLQKGEKVLCFAPDFSMYAFYSSLYELEVVTMDKEADLTINVDKAIKFANENDVKAIVFSNPCNPTSLGLDRESVEKLVKNVSALVVLDEAYMDFWNMNESLLDSVNEYDNLIVLKTCSKALAMAGIRLGLCVANKTITQKLRAAKSPYNVNVLTQSLATYFLSDKEGTKNRIEAVKASVKDLYAKISALEMPDFITIYKPVTNFLFIRTDKAEHIFNYLLDNSIAIRFMGKYLRISAGSPEENAEVERVLKKYKAERN